MRSVNNSQYNTSDLYFFFEANFTPAKSFNTLWLPEVHSGWALMHVVNSQISELF